MKTSLRTLVECIVGCAMVAILAGCPSTERPRDTVAPAAGESPPAAPPRDDPAERAVDEAGSAVVTTHGGSFHLRVRPAPEDMPSNEMFTLEVWLAEGSAGEPPGGDLTLDVDAAMPAHRHGMNTQPRVTDHGDGRFTVAGMLLHMAGRWEVYFDVTRAGVTERGQLAVELE